MKLIIAGSRTLNVTIPFIADCLDTFDINPTMIVSGTASGIDRCGEDFAQAVGIEIKRYSAKWDINGKSAGPIRNKEMADFADALLLIWDGESKGSKNMLWQMQRKHKPIYEVIIRKNNEAI